MLHRSLLRKPLSIPSTIRSSIPRQSLPRNPHSLPPPKRPYTTRPPPSSSKLSRPPKTLLHLIRQHTRRLLNTSRRRHSNKNPSQLPHNANGNPVPKPEPEPQTLGAKMRKLSREYGWSALGVYLALSALDFPLCYLLVRYLGTERIGAWEQTIKTTISTIIPTPLKTTFNDWRAAMKASEAEITGDNDVSEHVEMAGWGVEEADQKNKSDASLATQLALAYAIHKSFIFVRVPLTAAVTPKVVRMLRSWGWDIGKRTTKEMKAARRASLPVTNKKRARRWGLKRKSWDNPR